jgi:C-terminal processing protease CtpA/Prc
MLQAGSTSVVLLRRKSSGAIDHVMLHRADPSALPAPDPDADEEDDDDVAEVAQKPVGLGMVFLPADGKGGRVIKRLKEGSAADAHGEVLPGDRCFTIDGKTVDCLTDRELSDANKGPVGSTAVVVLRSKGGVRKACVLKRREPVFDSIVEGCGSELSYNSSIASGLTASDSSGRSGLGLTFHEWSPDNGGMRVKRVKKGGAADNSRQISPGDIVKTIDGVSLDKTDNRQLLKLLMGIEGSIAVGLAAPR